MIRKTFFDFSSFLHLDRMFYDIKRRKNYITILSLHRIADEPDFFWPPIKIKTFRAILEYCVQCYDVVQLSQLSARRGNRPKLILSFDDGYYDFLENALPILVHYGLPSNHNVVIDCVEKNQIIWTQELGHLFAFLKGRDYVGAFDLENQKLVFNGKLSLWISLYFQAYRRLLQMKKNDRIKQLKQWQASVNCPDPEVRMMNWEDLKLCLKQNVEIGSHTVSHHTLTTLDPDELRIEVTNSKNVIEQQLGIICNAIAVPNGQSNPVVAQAIERAGYKVLLLANDDFVNEGSIANSLLQLGRMNVLDEPHNEFKLRMEGFHRFIKNGKL